MPITHHAKLIVLRYDETERRQRKRRRENSGSSENDVDDDEDRRTDAVATPLASTQQR